jgi:hypothetical protein
MLKWIEMEHENGYIGFDDDCPRYFVREDEDGWYWEDSYGFGCGGLDTAEQAKAEAEADMPAPEYDEMPFDAEEAFMVLADLLYEQRREERMGW